jgi:hypothetical protein
MSKNFAVIKNNVVINKIIADTIEIAEEVTSLECVECSDTNGLEIGWFMYEPLKQFIPPKPFESWILNEEEIVWGPPVAYPEDEENYIWNESTLSWDLVE